MKKHILLLLLLNLLFSLVPEAAPKPSRKESLVTITTSLGEINVVLYDETPQHKANFLKLAKSGFYNQTTFHRIIPDFMIQGGDANSKDTDASNDGAGDPGYRVPAEIIPGLKHTYGAIAAARNNNPQKESNGSQFYIVQQKNGLPHLDNNYTVFGQVVKGMEVVDKIANQPKDYRDRPVTNIPMTVTVKKISRKKIQKLYGYPAGPTTAAKP